MNRSKTQMYRLQRQIGLRYLSKMRARGAPRERIDGQQRMLVLARMNFRATHTIGDCFVRNTPH